MSNKDYYMVYSVVCYSRPIDDPKNESGTTICLAENKEIAVKKSHRIDARRYRKMEFSRH